MPVRTLLCQCAAAVALAAITLPTVVRADVVQLAPSADTSIYDEGALSNGAGNFIFAGATRDDALRRALMRFDVAGSIPAGSVVTDVTLTLTLSRSKNSTADVGLHVLNRTWGEGSAHADAEEGKGAPSSPGDATWVDAVQGTTPWTNPGGDFGMVASATTTVTRSDGDFVWTSAAMIDDVQAWLDSAVSNHGWILIGDEAQTASAKQFGSRESVDAASAPELAVTFTPPGPSGACCAPAGTCGVTVGSGNCAADYQGDGTSCVPNPCPQPAGACCLPDAAASCMDVQQASCDGLGGSFRGTLSACAAVECPVVLTPYLDALPLPAVAQPLTGSAGAEADYTLAIREFTQQLHSELPATRVWGFDDGNGASFPGPTIEAATDAPVQVTWRNDLRNLEDGQLRTAHHLPIENCLHGAATDAARAVLHLHGGHVDEAYDGYPDLTIEPGEEVTYLYRNWQQAAMLWYHDHALGITRLNVYMGLAGLYLVRDAAEAALNLPDGAYEVPLVVQDRTFAPDGSLVYPAAWRGHFFGDTAMVNGKVWPYLNVDQGKYRLRLLNGSNSRAYTFTLSNGADFVQIGSDGGLLAAPQVRNVITLTSGERADVIVDFAPYAPGTEIILENSANAPYPNGSKLVIPEIMKFVVGAGSGFTAAIPGSLIASEVLDEGDSVIERTFDLEQTGDACGGAKWLINGLGWDDITEFPQLGTTEVWRFVNRTGVSHPMHMHLVFFQVLDRQAFDLVDGVVQLIGNPTPADPWEAGWKDTVNVNPNEVVRVIARFEDFVGKYAYHCHILEHEDHEMMRQFQTVTTCGDGARGIPDEACDDGNGVDGDGCDTNCTISICGNGIAAGGEACDGSDFAMGSDTCIALDPIAWVSGTLGCTGGCALDTGGCVAAGPMPCFSDEDGDGHSGTAQTILETQSCNAFDTGGRPWTDSDGGDCNDDPLDACATASYGGAVELCDSCDNDCDALVDDADPDIASGDPGVTGANVYYVDGDADGCGAVAMPGAFCATSPPGGWADDATDPDDSDGECCGNATAEGSEACDGSDFASGTDACNDLDPGAWASGTLGCTAGCGLDTSTCVPVGQIACWSDEDGDGQSGTLQTIADNLGCGDFDTDGRPWTGSDGGDCNDDPLDACATASYGGAVELCDSCDNDCDTLLDDADPDVASGDPGVTGANVYYVDGDADGCGAVAMPGAFCAASPPGGWADDATDPDDGDGECCGNAISEGGEACDGGDFAGGSASCVDADPMAWLTGTLGCTAACELETSGCTAAGPLSCWSDEDGDGHSGTEQTILETQSCDAFDTGGRPWTSSDGGDCNDDPLDACATATHDGATELCDSCDNDCDALVDNTPGSCCGNGNMESGEACDDGNLVAGDGCEDDCSLTQEPMSDAGVDAGTDASVPDDAGPGPQPDAAVVDAGVTPPVTSGDAALADAGPSGEQGDGGGGCGCRTAGGRPPAPAATVLLIALAIALRVRRRRS